MGGRAGGRGLSGEEVRSQPPSLEHPGNRRAEGLRDAA